MTLCAEATTLGKKHRRTSNDLDIANADTVHLLIMHVLVMHKFHFAWNFG